MNLPEELDQAKTGAAKIAKDGEADLQAAETQESAFKSMIVNFAPQVATVAALAMIAGFALAKLFAKL